MPERKTPKWATGGILDPESEMRSWLAQFPARAWPAIREFGLYGPMGKAPSAFQVGGQQLQRSQRTTDKPMPFAPSETITSPDPFMMPERWAKGLKGFRGFPFGADIGGEWGPESPSMELQQRGELKNQILILAASLGIDYSSIQRQLEDAGYLDMDKVPVNVLAQMFTSLRNQANLLPFGDMGSRQARINLSKAVETGAVSKEQAWGKGTPWEKWQHGEADKWNREQGFSNLPPPEQLNRLDQYIEEAEALGINVSSARKTLDTAIRTPQTWKDIDADAVIGNQMMALVSSINRKKEQQQETQSASLAQSYRPWYAQFTKERGGYEWPASQFSGFAPWLETQPEFAEERRKEAVTEYGEFPRLRSAYQQAKEQAPLKTGTFKQWQTSTPAISAAFGEVMAEKTRPTRIRAPRWAKV